jgi:hypothetical protein
MPPPLKGSEIARQVAVQFLAEQIHPSPLAGLGLENREKLSRMHEESAKDERPVHKQYVDARAALSRIAGCLFSGCLDPVQRGPISGRTMFRWPHLGQPELHPGSSTARL